MRGTVLTRGKWLEHLTIFCAIFGAMTANGIRLSFYNNCIAKISSETSLYTRQRAQS
ncbi:RAxF-45 family protein [Cytobacillus sp. FSL W7-1323]|nr:MULTISPECIES: RAxF-45 family protein [Cytobacillus]